MIAALAAEYNLAVRFKKKVQGEKNFDMFIQEIPCEVETILDQIPWAMQPASDVRKEILGSLKREKLIEKILDGLRQVAKMILVNSTASSLSWGINISTSHGKVIYPVEKALKLAVDHATCTRLSIQVVVFGTSIDYEHNYRLSAFFISYCSDGGINVDSSKLSIDDIYISKNLVSCNKKER